MDNTNLLSYLGYKVGTRLSAIKSSTHIQLKSEHNYQNKIFDNVSDGLMRITKAIEQTLEQDDPTLEISNLYKLGFNYSLNKVDPTAQEIWKDIIKDSGNDIYVSKIAENVSKGLSKRNETIDKVNYLFNRVIYGVILHKSWDILETVKAVVINNQAYFQTYFQRKSLDQDFNNTVRLVEIFNSLSIDLETTLEDYEKQKALIASLQSEYRIIKSPDKKRTILDRIDSINEKLETSKSPLSLRENLFYEGSLIAIRGQNPKLFELIKQYSSLVYHKNSGWDYLESRKYLTDDPVQNAEIVIQRIGEGYAFSYHLTYLEKNLNELDIPSDINSNEDLFQIKLKWLGQKNQLYDVLRQLKSEELIGNSYEDLSVFLKQSVDIFRDTSLSTINKEISKNKRPPKNKRVSIDI